MPDMTADANAALAETVARTHAALERKWAEEKPPEEPVDKWRLEFCATAAVAASVVKFAKLSGAQGGFYRRIHTIEGANDGQAMDQARP